MVYEVGPGALLGVALLNLGGPTLTLREAGETYPRELRAGVSYRFFSGRGTVSTEVDHRSGVGRGYRGGGEFWIHPRLALRLGYDHRSAAGGLSCPFGTGMQLDYGLSDHDLGLVHRVGFSYRFGGFAARSEAVPPVFSPLAEPAVTQLELTARTRAEARRWTLRVTDRSNRIVRQFGGEGEPPAHVVWDGMDEAGLTVPDGVYTHVLVVTDVEGHDLVSPAGTVQITTAGPQGMVPVRVPVTGGEMK
jgi:hypothetical protein